VTGSTQPCGPLGGWSLPAEKGGGYRGWIRGIAFALGVTALVAGCGGGGGARTHALPAQAGGSLAAAVTARAVSCITRTGYGGLGASVRLFDANNNNSTGPAEPTPGAAWYLVNAIARGCVAAYSVQDSASPPLRTRDMLDLVSPYLPDDATAVITTPDCVVYRSAELGRALGLPYAKATALAQIGSLRKGFAQVRASVSSSC
jgi:hypothetical protein